MAKRVKSSDPSPGAHGSVVAAGPPQKMARSVQASQGEPRKQNQRKERTPQRPHGKGSVRRDVNIRGLAEAASLSDDALLEQQVSQLLQEVRVVPDSKPARDALSAFEKLKACLGMMPEGHKVDARSASPFASALLHSEEATPRLALRFLRPQAVFLGGSFLQGWAARPHAVLDTFLVLPKESLNEKDFLNYRYHAKRFLFLEQIKQHLQGEQHQDWVDSLSWSTAHSMDACKPDLLLRTKQCPQLPLLLRPRISTSAFDAQKLRPARNNVRWMTTKDAQPLATPHYNHSILEDMLEGTTSSRPGELTEAAQQALEGEHSAPSEEGPEGERPGEESEEDEGDEGATGVPGEHMGRDSVDSIVGPAIERLPRLRETLLMLRVWCEQRWPCDQSPAADAFGDRHVALICAYLALPSTSPAGAEVAPRLAPSMTAVQMFRVTLDFFANSSTLEAGVRLPLVPGLGPDACAASTASERWSALKSAFPVVMATHSCLLNLTFRVSKTALQELRRDASQTLKALFLPRACWGCSGTDPVSAAFIARVDSATKFDVHVRIGLHGPPSPSAPRHPDELRRLQARGEKVALQALTDRAVLVRATMPAHELVTSLSGLEQQDAPPHVSLSLGVLLASPDTALRMADKGPSAERKEDSRKFRAFWGSKSELRRWKDGSVTECAAWECPATERHLIIPRILKHALGRHLALEDDDISVTGGQLDFALLEGGKDPMQSWPQLQAAQERVSKMLRQLSKMPLPIVAVQPLSPAMRQTAVFPPQPLSSHKDAEGVVSFVHSKRRKMEFTEPLELALQLEGSGKWPQQPEAVAKTQLAFCLHAAKCLQEQDPGVRVTATEAAVDVVVDSFAFRLLAMPPKPPPGVPSSATQNVNSNNNSSSSSSSSSLVRGLPRDLEKESAYNGLMSSVLALFPQFSPVARLAKRWVGAHLFGGELREEAVELIVASCFLQPQPCSPPQSRITGLLRFLRMLSSFDWESTALAVDPNADLSPAQVAAIQNSFRSSRARAASRARRASKEAHPGSSSTPPTDKGPFMCLASPCDPSGFMWTAQGPSKEGLLCLKKFAESSADALQRLIVAGREATPPQWKSIFCTPLASTLDGVLVLSKGAFPHPTRALFHSEKILLRCGALSASEGLSGEKEKGKEESLERRFIEVLEHHRGDSESESAEPIDFVVGFDPLKPLVETLRGRFKGATIMYDPLGGLDAVGVKWRGEEGKASSNQGKGVADGTQKYFRVVLREMQECCGDLVRTSCAFVQ